MTDSVSPDSSFGGDHPCVVCNVKLISVNASSEEAIKCDKSCHGESHGWYHAECLTQSYAELLQNQNEDQKPPKMDLTSQLFKLLAKIGRFEFVCHKCDPNSAPLPVWLCKQDIITWDNIESLCFDQETHEYLSNILNSEDDDNNHPSRSNSFLSPKVSPNKTTCVPNSETKVQGANIHTLSDQSVSNTTFDSDKILDMMMQMVKQNIQRDIDREKREDEREKRHTELIKTLVEQQNQKSVCNPEKPKVKSAVKLPECHIPVFSGKIGDWMSFWESFRTFIHNNADIPSVQKLIYLTSHVSGEAKMLVNRFFGSEANYPDIIAALCERYNNPQEIKNYHINRIQKLQPIFSVNASSLSYFYDSLKAEYSGILNLTKSEIETKSIFNTLMSTCILSKLHKDVYLLMGSWSSTFSSDISEFFTLLHKAIVLYRSAPFQNSTGESSKNSFRGNNDNQNKKNVPNQERDDNKEPTNSCIFCGEKHFNDQCTKYTTCDERFKRSIEKNLCTLCFSSKHKKFECTSTKECVYCRKHDHDRSMCFSKFKTALNANKMTTKKKEPSSLGVETNQDNKNTGNPKTETGCLSVFSYDEVVQKAASQAINEKLDLTHNGDPCIAMQTAKSFARNISATMECPINILVDTGCKRTYGTESLSDKLELTVKKTQNINLTTFGQSKSKLIVSKLVDLDLVLKDSSSVNITINTVPQIAGRFQLDPISLSNTDKQLLESLPLADRIPEKSTDFEIDLLIGNDIFPYLLLDEPKKYLSSGVCLISTKLGWITCGQIIDSSVKDFPTEVTCDEGKNELVEDFSHLSLFANSCTFPEDSSQKDIECLWSMEPLGIQPKELTDISDKIAQEYFDKTVEFNKDRISVKWPYKNENPDLPTNFFLALKRLRLLLNTLGKDSELLKKYNENFQNQLAKGVIEKVEELPNSTQKDYLTHYIPHFPVFTPDKATTKMRVVFDASAHLPNKSSLNDCLYRGPVILSDLCGLIMRLRMKPIALIADIEKAFLQVELHEEARDVTRFLWLKDPTNPSIENNLQIYRFCRVPFGAISSPFLLGASISWLLTHNLSPVTDLIRKNMYVDNMITGVHTVEEANAFYDQTKSVFQLASMNMREWASNSLKTLEYIPESDRVQGNVIKILGLIWNKSQDTFVIPVPKQEVLDKVSSKRGVLQAIASVFDPMGYLSCVLIKSKIFMQKLWLENLTWDSPLSLDQIQKWKQLNSCFSTMREMSLPRFIFSDQNAKFDILCFCDASSEAYCATIYLRAESEDGKITTELIFAKTRLSPRNKSVLTKKSKSSMTIPRLELLAFLVGIRCLEFVASQLHIPIRSKIIWSDSQCVLDWLKSPKQLKTFVRNRANEINSFPDIQKRYVYTKDNPADLATRSVSPEPFPWEFWWRGPPWLSLSVDNWPTWDRPISSESLYESDDFYKEFIRKQNPTVTSSQICQESCDNLASPSRKFLGKSVTPLFESSLIGVNSQKIEIPMNLSAVIDISRFSSMTVLLKHTAWILRFIDNLKTKRFSRTLIPLEDIPYLNGSEIRQAKLYWERHVQFTAFPKEFNDPSSSVLTKQFWLRIDKDQILRCEGRLGSSDLKYESKKPKLLPNNHPFTFLMIQIYHEYLLHASKALVLTNLRKEYWVINGPSTVNQVLFRCQFCKKSNAKSFRAPEMPNLPSGRISRMSPFTWVGVDYCGPFYCNLTSSQNNRTTKVWICLFTCLTVRAIHLEIVTDLTAESFLLSLRRFTSRRGFPQSFITDNASQFKLVKKVLEKAESKSIFQIHANRGISWEFIPEYAPWFGGFYERMIGLVKSCIRKSLPIKKILSYEQFITLITEIESVLNSRPLESNPSDDNSHISVITLRDFLSLNPRVNTPVLDSEFPNFPESFSKQVSVSSILQMWKQGMYYLEIFWKHWYAGYLSSLRNRHMHDKFKQSRSTTTRVPIVGEIVMLEDKSSIRGFWKIGRIVKLNESKDGKIRSVQIMMPNRKLMIRPIVQIFPLELSIEREN